VAGQAALASQIGRFVTEWLTRDVYAANFMRTHTLPEAIKHQSHTGLP
jgi:hypothetical protein